MNRTLGLGLGWALALGVVVGACTGPEGAEGKQGLQGLQGDAGPPGTGTPSVSAVTPPYGFLGRTVDLTVAGSGTTWSSATTVAFADPAIKVNKVTAASATGLLINVTIGAAASIAATDVTVTDGSTTEVYKGAFSIKAPLLVTVDPPAGVPQGGLANLHVQMLDVTTPFDPDNTSVTLSSPDVAMSQPAPTDFAFDLTIEADVLATTGTFDLVVSSGVTGSSVDSPAKAAFSIAARAPVTLSATTPATGTLQTEIDTGLYEFTPADATQRFVQFTLTTSTSGGALVGTAIPKSGKYADALAPGFAIRYGEGTTSTDPFYVVAGDSNGLFGPGPTPANVTLTTFQAACTAGAEAAETAAKNDDTIATAQVVTTLPALISGTLGYGAVAPAADQDYYAITVTGAPKQIHVVTGGDALTDTVVDVYDPSSTELGPSADDDLQEDFTVSAPTNGTYYVLVNASNGQSSQFDPTHNTYQLFIEVK